MLVSGEDRREQPPISMLVGPRFAAGCISVFMAGAAITRINRYVLKAT